MTRHRADSLRADLATVLCWVAIPVLIICAAIGAITTTGSTP